MEIEHMQAGPAKLLVAEDEENVRTGIINYIKHHSKRIGTIYEAKDGQTALELLIRYKPELLLIDIQMPYKNGIEVLFEAQEAGVRPKTVILSGFNEFTYAQRAIRLGVVDYLLKPCRPQDLLAKLESLIDNGEPDEAKADKPLNRLVQVAIGYINEHYTESLSLSGVAQHIGVSSPYLSSLFSQELGYGFTDYLNRVRVERACAYLHDPSIKTYEVSERVGYNNEKYFTRQFKKVMGVSPAAYRKTLVAESRADKDPI